MEDTLDLLNHAAAEARAGQGSIMHLVGTPGLGKSTLMTRFVEGVDSPSDRAAVVSARCDRHRRQALVEELVAQVAEGVRAIELSEGPKGGGAHGPVPLLLPGEQLLAAQAAFDEADEKQAVRRCADLLLSITRHHPVIMAIDDAHRMDRRSRLIIEALAEGLSGEGEEPGHRLLVLLASAQPLEGVGSGAPLWRPSPDGVITLKPWGPDQVAEALEGRLGRLGPISEAYRAVVTEISGGNPRIMEALISISERAGALRRDDEGEVGDLDLVARPEAEGLQALSEGRLIPLPANVRADLQTTALVGPRITQDLLSRIWGVPGEAARLRVQSMQATGLILPEGDGAFIFISDEVQAALVDAMDQASRISLHGQIGALLRGEISTARPSAELIRPGLDVTETWSETRRRDRRLREEFEGLWAATNHFAAAGQWPQASEAAVALGERLFETSGGYSYLAGRQGRREDRERRHRIYMAVQAAETHLERAQHERWTHGALSAAHTAELLALHTRLMVLKARLKEVLGDFNQARHLVDAAVALANHGEDVALSLEALRVQIEICYAAGEQTMARSYLGELFGRLAHSPSEAAVPILVWMAEAVAQWEWVGLHGRYFPRIIDALEAHKSPKAAIKARIERLACGAEIGGYGEAPPMLKAICDQAQAQGEAPYAAELLSAYAGEMIQSVVDVHYDSLSGEFFQPDFYGLGDQPPPLMERLQHPLTLMAEAERLAQDAGHRVALLRVLTTRLGTIYDARERLGDLLERWMPIHGADQPPRLMEMVESLEVGPFNLADAEALTESVIELCTLLELNQVLADTLYEALDRELPVAMRSATTWFNRARVAYNKVGDVYGQITLALVEHRVRVRRGESPAPLIEAIYTHLTESEGSLSLEQRAFVSMRLGELMLDTADQQEEAQALLEKAMVLYEQLGEMAHVQTVGELLSNLYRAAGDLGRYRVLRERFMALDARLPGVDPLGLEMRVEHLLGRARQEADEERAIEMLERCVGLFARIPDGTTRIDECFVEISKICRRRAEESQTEGGFHDWMQRSLSAVETATSINRSLGNHHRLFEEYHELFDDLIGLGDMDSYLRVRAESRELAFAIGHIGELMYLFEEHLQVDPEVGMDPARIPEIRGFYEALLRMLDGLGLGEEAMALKLSFLDFLEAMGLDSLRTLYTKI